MPTYLFLPDDYARLEQMLGVKREHVVAIAGGTHDTTTYNSETYHDNPAFDLNNMDLTIHKGDMRAMANVHYYAVVVQPSTSTREVGLGSLVRYRNIATGFVDTLRIGSHYTFGAEDTVAYSADLGQILLSMRVGEQRTGTINREPVTLEVISISP